MLVVVDVRRGIVDDDYIMLDFAEYNDIPCAIVLSKVDKLSRSKMMQAKMKIERETGLPTFLFSTLDANHTPNIQKYILKNVK